MYTQNTTFQINANTQGDFTKALKEAKSRRLAPMGSKPNRMRISLSQLTPTNVLTMTVKSPVGTSLHKQRKIMESKRGQLYGMAKSMGINIQTTVNAEYTVVMIRLNPNWPVAHS